VSLEGQGKGLEWPCGALIGKDEQNNLAFVLRATFRLQVIGKRQEKKAASLKG
jgi:hypothetical protein